MATIDLGKIKLVWRGTYNNSTAYAVDDVVEYADGSVTSSYICTTASTGNAPSSGGTAHGSWAYMAKGQAVSPTTTQGDIIYRGSSADVRLAKGTADQVLKMNSGATAPEWGLGGGVLQVKQWIKESPYQTSNTSDDVTLPSPFDGTATITPAAAGNMIKVEFFNSHAHGETWRSGYEFIEWSSDGGSTYYGLAGANFSTYCEGSHINGNSLHISCMFNPNTTNAVKVRVIHNAHGNGHARQVFTYNSESNGDTSNIAVRSTNSVKAVGAAIILTELASGICTTTTVA